MSIKADTIKMINPIDESSGIPLSILILPTKPERMCPTAMTVDTMHIEICVRIRVSDRSHIPKKWRLLISTKLIMGTGATLMHACRTCSCLLDLKKEIMGIGRNAMDS